jgi:hypothetical protein
MYHGEALGAIKPAAMQPALKETGRNAASLKRKRGTAAMAVPLGR